MVKNKGDKKKLNAKQDWASVLKESDETLRNRRLLKRASQNTQVALTNPYCCHLDEISRTISLFTAADG